MRGTLSTLGRVHTAGRKVLAGAPRFGRARTAGGVAHLAWLKLRRPPTASVRVIDRRTDMVFRFACPSQVMPMLVVFGGFIEPEFELVDALIGPDSTFVDVGGGIGTYSVYAALRTARPVHVFEPTAENADAIRLNARANGVGQRVVVHELALSDRSGYSTIVTGRNTFTNGVADVRESRQDADGTVRVMTLDEFCRSSGLDHIDFLKIDVAGYEPAVVRGASDLLSQQRVDVVTLELSLRFIDTYEELNQWGYRFYFTVDGQLVPIPALSSSALIEHRPSVFHANVVAVASGASDSVIRRVAAMTA